MIGDATLVRAEQDLKLIKQGIDKPLLARNFSDTDVPGRWCAVTVDRGPE